MYFIYWIDSQLGKGQKASKRSLLKAFELKVEKRFENKAPISFSKFFSFLFLHFYSRTKEFFFEILFTQLKHILPSLFDIVFFKFRGIRTTQNRILIFVFLFHLPGLECAHRSDSLLGNELASHSEDCELESFPKHHGSGLKTIPDWFHTPSGSDSWMPGHLWAWCWAETKKYI